VSDPANDNYRPGDIPDHEIRDIFLAAERIARAGEENETLAQSGELTEDETVKP
jgi:hypothetical protein